MFKHNDILSNFITLFILFYFIIPLLSIVIIYEGCSCMRLRFSCCMGCPGVFRIIYASFGVFENALVLGNRFLEMLRVSNKMLRMLLWIFFKDVFLNHHLMHQELPQLYWQPHNLAISYLHFLMGSLLELDDFAFTFVTSTSVAVVPLAQPVLTFSH